MEEIDEESIFNLDYLYGEQFDYIMGFLNMKCSDLIGQTALDFEDVICKHIEQKCQSDKFYLPSFGEGFQWVNTSRPLYFDDLKNKVYVMDFFTYCCINCIHILPHLKKVENFYADNPGFAVIGIHSPKFPNEKDLNRVTEAVIRNNIQHPVLNDSESKLWKTYSVNCWPTVFIVGPGQTLLFVLIGEAHIDKLFLLCHHILNYFKSHDMTLDLQPLPILQIKENSKEADMLFPGNISTNGDHVVVSDTGHNRLLLMSRSLSIKEIIGSGTIGSEDGSFNQASFNSPHGTAWYQDALYIADTGNHSIRKVCFKTKFVTTVFSRKSHAADLSSSSFDTEASFQSPWDVCIGPKLDSDLNTLNVLYIAVAGSHQIWALDLEADDPSSHGICVPFAGSGKEENRQNLYRFKAGFAQPSGITYSPLSPNHLFVADSESSTIKSIALKGGAVQTIVGGSRDPSDLFQFGDKDGKHINAKLQHPMSVCVLNDQLLAITDTYNHKIKLVNVTRKECFTYNTDLDFCEPSGVCIMDGTLLVADTNNHRIIPVQISEDKIDMANMNVQYDQVIEIPNLLFQNAPITTIPVGHGGKIFCHFRLNTGSNYEFNGFGGQKWDVSFKGDGKLCVVQKNKNLFGNAQPSLILQSASDVEASHENSSSEVIVKGFFPFCDKNLKICCSKEITFKINVNVTELGGFKLVCLNFNAFVD